MWFMDFIEGTGQPLSDTTLLCKIFGTHHEQGNQNMCDFH